MNNIVWLHYIMAERTQVISSSTFNPKINIKSRYSIVDIREVKREERRKKLERIFDEINNE